MMYNKKRTYAGKRHKKAESDFSLSAKIFFVKGLQLRSERNERFAGFVAGVLDEVLLEAGCKILCLLIPLCGIRVGVAGIEDVGIDAGQGSGNFEVEVRYGLGLGLVDRAVEDRVDDAAGILDGDTLARAVPTGVDEVRLGAALFHALGKLFRILRGMKFEERLTEASRERRGRLGYAALRAGELCGKSGEEVVLRLLGREYGNGRKNAERISRKEDDILSRGSRGNGANYLLDVIDRVGNAGVLRNALVVEVDLAVFVERDVFKKRVASDSVVDIGLGVLIEVDDLSIAAALEVEHAVVVPAVLIVADKKTLGIGGKGGLTGTGQTEEYSGVLAVHIRVRGAVHGSDALEGKVIVHHGEHTLLHLAAVPGVEYDLLAARDVEHDSGLGVEAELFVVLHLSLGRVVNDEIGFEVFEFLGSGADEHVLNEVRLPCNFHYEADSHARIFVCAAERIDDEKTLVGELFLSELLNGFPRLLACGVVIVLVTFRGPPNGVLGVVVHNNELILGGAAGVDAGHNVDRAELADLAFLVTLEAGLGLFFEQHLIRRVVNDFRRSRDTVLGEIDLLHRENTSCILKLYLHKLRRKIGTFDRFRTGGDRQFPPKPLFNLNNYISFENICQAGKGRLQNVKLCRKRHKYA